MAASWPTPDDDLNPRRGGPGPEAQPCGPTGYPNADRQPRDATRAGRPRRQTDVWAPLAPLDWRRTLVGVAQLVELRVVVPAVAGSNPVAHLRKPCKAAVFPKTGATRRAPAGSKRGPTSKTAYGVRRSGGLRTRAITRRRGGVIPRVPPQLRRMVRAARDACMAAFRSGLRARPAIAGSQHVAPCPPHRAPASRRSARVRPRAPAARRRHRRDCWRARAEHDDRRRRWRLRRGRLDNPRDASRRPDLLHLSSPTERWRRRTCIPAQAATSTSPSASSREADCMPRSLARACSITRRNCNGARGAYSAIVSVDVGTAALQRAAQVWGPPGPPDKPPH